jgi:hypothetical protein
MPFHGEIFKSSISPKGIISVLVREKEILEHNFFHLIYLMIAYVLLLLLDSAIAGYKCTNGLWRGSKIFI